MSWKRSALALVTFVVLTFGLAAVWHLGLFASTYAELGAYTRPDPIFALGLASVVLEGIVFVYLYPFFATGKRPALEGARFGLLMGVFMGAYGALAVGAKVSVSSLPTWLAVEGASFVIQFAIVGAAVGAVYGTRVRRAGA